MSSHARHMREMRKKMESSHAKKMSMVMDEFMRGDLKTGSGKTVKSRKQAIAIALSQARKSRRKRA